MRLQLPVHGFLVALPLALGVVAAAPPVAAQSLFDALFGGPKPSYQAPNTYPGANRLLPPNGINTGLPYTARPMYQPRRSTDDEGDESSSGKPGGRGGHHTVCVRMCDGYYWPVSYSAPRSRFYRDANACQSSCGSEAKLFHYPTSGGKMEDAVDLTGRVYSRLPTAFKYRKTLVQGCTCKPAPWSEAEIDRHRIYALNEEAAKGGDPSVTKVTAIPVPPPSGTQASTLVSDATDNVDIAPKVKPSIAVAANSRPDEDAETLSGQRKAARFQTADAGTVSPRSRLRSAAPLPPARIRPHPAQTASGGFWGGGPSKYTWPGDAPARVR